MKRIVPLLTMLCVLASYGCVPLWDTRDPDAICQRAEELRSQAAGFRKDARDQAALMEKTRQQLQSAENRLEFLQNRGDNLTDQIGRVRQQMSLADPSEAEQYKPTLERYRGERTVVSAKADDEQAAVNALRDHLNRQSRIRKGYLQKASALEREARSYEEYARRLSES